MSSESIASAAGHAPGKWTQLLGPWSLAMPVAALSVWLYRSLEIELNDRLWGSSHGSPLPLLVLTAGLGSALILGWAVRLAQVSAARSRELAESNRRLTEEISIREDAQKALSDSEEQLRQSQKMEAIGRLAGGVAHDFNNLLTAINGYSDFLLQSIDRDDPRRDDVREIRKAATRASSLTQQLLAFTRRQIRQPRVLDINIVITDLSRMLRRVIGEDIQLRTNLQPGVGSVRVDPSQLEQILLNLVVNAGDAMPNGGTVTVETRFLMLDEMDARSMRGLAAGRYILLRVIDTGCGMDEQTIARIFEPFFTTKGGKGTGLGLSTVYASVEQNGGAIAVQSKPGAGTTFNVYLPSTEEAAETFASGAFVPTAARGTETILLAEDEDGVRRLAARILERHGYTVIEARNGREAVGIAERYEGEIDLLLTDVVMPEMGGRRLAELVRERRHRIDVLYMSGYTDGEISRRGELNADTAFLQKPFTAQSLLSKVREILDFVPSAA
jgi:two-component system, cell cycle sensor histidine kinase and response regulator CckA